MPENRLMAYLRGSDQTHLMVWLEDLREEWWDKAMAMLNDAAAFGKSTDYAGLFTGVRG
jgi:hypothetical protein